MKADWHQCATLINDSSCNLQYEDRLLRSSQRIIFRCFWAKSWNSSKRCFLIFHSYRGYRIFVELTIYAFGTAFEIGFWVTIEVCFGKYYCATHCLSRSYVLGVYPLFTYIRVRYWTQSRSGVWSPGQLSNWLSLLIILSCNNFKPSSIIKIFLFVFDWNINWLFNTAIFISS